MIELTIKDEELAKLADEGGEALYSLCRKEAEEFNEYIKSNPGDGDTSWLYREGLTDWELTSVASYIYQKIRRRI